MRRGLRTSIIATKSIDTRIEDHTRPFVKIVEVGPRDGLQNESKIIPTVTKAELIHRLANTGLSVVEATSFVSEHLVPQMGDARELMRMIKRNPNVSYPVLAPNIRGVKAAKSAGANEIAIFTGASDAFVKRNINMTIDRSIEIYTSVIQMAKQDGMRVRGYVSCIAGCPYSGKVDPSIVADVAERLLNIGCYEISLGDTIGIGRPHEILAVIQAVSQRIPLEKLAIHCHDTYGQALANIYASLEAGIRIVDSSVAGLGGCPFARGATGNVATEDVVYMLEGNGFRTGVDLDKLVDVGHWISSELGRSNESRAARALMAKRDA
ncbi:aldolase [Coemansia reversa NRRL 1564]|uniref:hydroxymethylglutaryl-CoA lyase n=1 Tax=Coemansia reversa (strain ATCC 12441 / NRRL 1564) TaxID=763665 RepID=A0A2G5BJS0_COERN|nr:aldolase [Coemansia reversa NRRL 1564]|eukprot:PIA19256.1 aldolase [Coemansia reversa NRRL 1564]